MKNDNTILLYNNNYNDNGDGNGNNSMDNSSMKMIVIVIVYVCCDDSIYLNEKNVWQKFAETKQLFAIALMTCSMFMWQNA